MKPQATFSLGQIEYGPFSLKVVFMLFFFLKEYLLVNRHIAVHMPMTNDDRSIGWQLLYFL
jgi:hypothetical protein